MKLFMVYVGGACANSNVELHDVRFTIGESIEDCYDDLRKQWWGDPSRLHLDCWGEVEQADGYEVTIAAQGAHESPGTLFLVNLGGYDPEQFTELHQNVFVIAPDWKTAARRALTLVGHWKLPHRDNVFEVEKVINVSDTVRERGQAIVMTKATSEKPFRFTCDYRPIGEHRDEMI
ncbi:DUF1543 domain-containing protein [Burkholderia anthina]|uniref:DUF1543 domain-containing protein n=1 Tax=Burkholderia anthina TaxID=179879 RepID=A0A6P2G7D2_9BURK|nr:DUF1543 domain-containing protein [Burkholderia anthina]MBM2767545.1 DUF1543 domain-containing protein [Burkholderia anthina]VVU49179.1 hypothetical protein BAN20980_01878 [Burkholderia anthina]